jgi:hypothetical protein
MNEFNGMKIISTYTTKEAVADGFLVLIAESQSKEAGIKFPVYMTRAVWDKYVEVPKGMEGEQGLIRAFMGYIMDVHVVCKNHFQLSYDVQVYL